MVWVVGWVVSPFSWHWNFSFSLSLEYGPEFQSPNFIHLLVVKQLEKLRLRRNKPQFELRFDWHWVEAEPGNFFVAGCRSKHILFWGAKMSPDFAWGTEWHYNAHVKELVRGVQPVLNAMLVECILSLYHSYWTSLFYFICVTTHIYSVKQLGLVYWNPISNMVGEGWVLDVLYIHLLSSIINKCFSSCFKPCSWPHWDEDLLWGKLYYTVIFR